MLLLSILAYGITFSAFIATEKRDTKRTKEKQKKIPWSKDESSAVLEYFAAYINRNKIPGKGDIEACFDVFPILKSRPWKTVKDFVRNRIVKAQKLQKR